MLERTIDTMVRGVIYEGTAGEEIVERMCRLNEVPYALLDAPPDDAGAWGTAVRAEIDALLVAQRPTVR